MEKQRSAILLVLLLLLMCAGWWSVSQYQISLQRRDIVAAAVDAPVPDTNYRPQASLEVYHSTSQGQEIYSGSLALPVCDTFATSVSASGQPVHARIAFTILAYPGCSSQQATTSSPFLVSVGTQGSTTPILDGVEINGQPIAITLREK